MQLYIEIILLPVRKKLYLVKNDQELTVSSRYRVSGFTLKKLRIEHENWLRKPKRTALLGHPLFPILRSRRVSIFVLFKTDRKRH